MVCLRRASTLPLLTLPVAGCPIGTPIVSCKEVMMCPTEGTTDGTTLPGVQTVTSLAASETDANTTTTTATSTSATGTTAAPPDDALAVMLALDPPDLDAAGPVHLAIEASPAVEEVDILYRGEVLATLPPADFPYTFDVTSQRRCDGEELLTVVARDADGQTAEASAPLTCALPQSGSEAHRALLPGQTSSTVTDVAVHGDGWVAVGAVDGRMAVWALDAALEVRPGWPRVVGNWSSIPGILTLESSAVAVVVDAAQHIAVAGNLVQDGISRYYAGRLNADGAVLAEAQGDPHETASDLAVTSDGLVFLVGAVETSHQPAAFDWRVWSHTELGKQPPVVDTLPLGPGEEPDNPNQRSERARTVAVLTNGDLVVAGERDYRKLQGFSTVTRASWQRYSVDGQRMGPLWTSVPDDLRLDAATAVLALPGDAFALAGWMRPKAGQPPQLMSWRFEAGVLTGQHFEPVATAEATGLSRDREGNVVVAARRTIGGQLDAWAFAFGDWSAPAWWSQVHGAADGWDGYGAIACDDWGHCLAGGFLTVEGVVTAFLRLHNP